MRMNKIYIISNKPIIKLVVENSLIVDENGFVKIPINLIENCECGIIALDKE